MIELTDVSLHRGKRQVLHRLFLCVEPGEVVLISGSPGCGKTSLLSLLGGFQTACSGTVSVFEHDVAKLRSSSMRLLRRKLAFVPQQMQLILDLSVLENVRLALRVDGVRRKEATERSLSVLENFQLENLANARIKELSAGQRRQVCLARCFVRQASIFIADQPCNDLADEEIRHLATAIEGQRRLGTASVVASNNARLVETARSTGWRHLRLIDGRLASGDAALLHKEQQDDCPSSEPPNVLVFPAKAVAGLKE